MERAVWKELQGAVRAAVEDLVGSGGAVVKGGTCKVRAEGRASCEGTLCAEGRAHTERLGN